MISKEVSVRLQNLNVFATFLIVVMHLEYAGVNSIFACPTVNYITHCAVPAFFAMSGFFLVFSARKYGWIGVGKSRLHSLVIPYFALNTLFIPYLYVYQNVLHAGRWDGGMGVNFYTISRIYGLAIDMHPVCGGLWYVRCLLFFVVLSPLIVLVMRKLWTACIMLAALFAVVVALSMLNLPDPWPARLYSFFNIRGLLFFCVGIFLAVKYEAIACRKVSWKLLRVVSLGVLGALITLSSIGSNVFLNELKLVSAVWTIFVLMPTVQLPKWVVSSCFAIFVFHSLVFKVYETMISRCGILILSESRICSLIPLALALGSCYIATFVLRKYLPRFGEFLLGGRC